MDIVAGVLEHARTRPGMLAGGRLVCIDGPAGSGKTTLAAALAEVLPDPVVLHMDDMYAGWGGLDDELGPRLGGEILTPLAAGEPGHYRRYDWDLDRFAELHLVPPCDFLILEGVGSGDLNLARFRTTLVWVEAPDDLRLARGLARDRALFEREGFPWDQDVEHAKWTGFMTDEARFFAEHRVRESADVHVDGTAPI